MKVSFSFCLLSQFLQCCNHASLLKFALGSKDGHFPVGYLPLRVARAEAGKDGSTIHQILIFSCLPLTLSPEVNGGLVSQELFVIIMAHYVLLEQEETCMCRKNKA